MAALWVMADGRRREQRLYAFQQATLVWAVTEERSIDLESFIERGTCKPGKASKVSYGALAEAVDRHAAKIIANGGKFVMPE